MANLKTKKNESGVEDFLNSVENERRRKDGFELLKMMQEITGDEPKMWGPGIIGFGSYHYKYESGREGDWFQVGFSPRKNALSLYSMAGLTRFEELMGKLGKYKTGKSCLYINKLDDVDRDVLHDLIKQSVEHMSEKYDK